MFVGLAIGRTRLCRTSRPPDASHAIPPRVRLEASRHARIRSPSCGPSDLVLRPKPRNRPPMVLWANHQTPRARFGLPPNHLTRPPPCTGSIVHDFVLLVSPPCGPHPVPMSIGSLEPSLLVSPSPRGPSRLKTFRARSSPATTRTRPQPTHAH
jgi:hypothetical protein